MNATQEGVAPKNTDTSLSPSLKHHPAAKLIREYASTPDQKLNLSLCHEIQRHFTRFVCPHLHPSEAKVLMYILDRNIGWGKKRERVTINQIVHGIFQIDEENGCIEVVTEGVGMGSRQVTRWLNLLTDKGIIIKRRSEVDINELEMNLAWVPPRYTPTASPRNTAAARRMGVSLPTVWDRVWEQQEKEQSGEENDNIIPLPPQEGAKKVKALRQRKPETKTEGVESTKELTLDQLKQMWTKLVEETGEVPVTLKKDTIHALQNYMRRFRSAHPEVTVEEYLRWVTVNWRWLAAVQFAWMSKPPAPLVPDPGFLVSFCNAFEHAWRNKEETDRLRKLTGRERTIEKLLNKGYPLEVAEKEADQHHGLAENVKELKRLQAEAEKVERLRKAEAIHERQMEARRRREQQVADQLEETKRKVRNGEAIMPRSLTGGEKPFGDFED